MILEIDSSNRYQKRVSLKEGDKVVASETTGGDILAAVKVLLTSNQVDLKSLEKVTSTVEGESFTGLRVGASIANALNFATGKLQNLNDLTFPKYSSPPKITLPKVP